MLENIALASAAYSAEYSTQGEGIDKARDKARDKEYNTRRFRGERLTRTGDYAEREITSRENLHDRKNLCRELCRELCRSSGCHLTTMIPMIEKTFVASFVAIFIAHI